MNETKQQVSMARLYTALSSRECAGKKLRCLLHANHSNGDANPSASIHHNRLTCHSQGCFHGDDIFAVIGKVEHLPDFHTQRARIEELFSLNGHHHEKKIVAEYDYVDEHGALLFQAVRYDPKDFRQRRPDGKGGWIWDLKNTRKVLYRLPDVLQASAVLCVEGEKDVETAYTLGLPEGWAATCNPMGAGKWKPEFSEFLRDKNVVLCPDGIVNLSRIGPIFYLGPVT